MLRVQTTLCPSCNRNVPVSDGVCYNCGSPTSTSTFVETDGTLGTPVSPITVLSQWPKAKWAIDLDKTLSAMQMQASCDKVLDLIEKQARRDMRDMVDHGTRFQDMSGSYYR